MGPREDIRIEKIKASGQPLSEVLDGLILEEGANSLSVIWIVMHAFGLRLGEAKGMVGNRCHELKITRASSVE